MASKIVDRRNFSQVQHFLFAVISIMLVLCMTNSAHVTMASGVEGRGTNYKMIVIRCLERERQALLKFKQGLDDKFNRLFSWGSEEEEDNKDCCQWRGVRCSNFTGHVIRLDLRNGDWRSNSPLYRPLSGELSPSLQELHHLSYLDLSLNDFGQHSVPDFIWSLSNLQYLNLSRAGFYGSIPHQIANLTSLRHLDLGHTYFHVKSLDWLSHLRLLRYLDLSTVDLSEIHSLQPISELSFLTKLYMSYCQLSGMASITNSSSMSLTRVEFSHNNIDTSSSIHWFVNQSRESSLVDLDLSFNNFRSLPDTFGDLVYLQNVDLSCNSLHEVPRSFGNLTHLRSLDLSWNYHITGLLTQSLKVFSNKGIENSLEFLDLSWNRLSGSLPDFTRFSSLKHLNLQGNQLNGSFPTGFRQHLNLLVLRLSVNQITGTLPDLRSFPSLEVLDLSKNQLSGKLSESIGELSELKILDTSWNSFEGTISETHFKKLSKLKELDLSFNLLAWEYNPDWVPPFQLEDIGLASCKLGPQFPKWLQTQNNFSRLDISSAGISDTIPNWFWDLSPRLEYLNLSQNQINGCVPGMSLKFAKLQEMDLSSNQFEGSLPSLSPNITLLYLSKNMFSGSISAVCSYKFISSLDISGNLLSGELPDCLGNMENLVVLNVANNNLSGKIPTSIASRYRLETLSLRNNSFTGGIPWTLYEGIWLRILDLGENRLSGSIPNWIGVQSSRLIVLSLRKNEFSGSIPSNLCNLQDIQVLDLSQNNLSGNIPRCFSNFTSLAQRNSTGRTIVFNFTGHNGLQEYMGNAFVEWKGQEQEYRSILGLLKSIDLSGNKLDGEIPREFSSLKELVSLNLSRNDLTGKIIQEIGEMRKLESLDLSRNELSGPLPTGLVMLNFLSVFDVSNNNFSGRIPSSTQLQGFNVTVYAGNDRLCGLPLPNKCPGDETFQILSTTDIDKDSESLNDDDDKFLTPGFYISVVLGFALGFWGIFGTILFNHKWGNAYFKFLQNMKDWIYVTTQVNMARLRRKLRGVITTTLGSRLSTGQALF